VDVLELGLGPGDRVTASTTMPIVAGREPVPFDDSVWIVTL